MDENAEIGPLVSCCFYCTEEIFWMCVLMACDPNLEEEKDTS